MELTSSTQFPDQERVRALRREILRLRKKRNLDTHQYVSAWKEKELLNEEVVEAFVVVLRTRGCYWAWRGGCSMCGYVRDSTDGVTTEALLVQLDKALQLSTGERVLKIFNSGSFFDDAEVPPDARIAILERVGERFEKIIVESLPQFITKERIEESREFCRSLEVAIGLESSNRTVQRYSILKPFPLDSFAKASKIVHDSGGTVKGYLLVKPPFLTESQAIEDAIRSARDVAPYADAISFNPVNVQRDTLVEMLWKRSEYRAPWLWSVVEILESLEDLEKRIICFPTGGGTKRGAHNCGRCDERVLKRLEEFSLGMTRSFSDLDCECREEWLDYKSLHDVMCTSVDPKPFFESNH